MNSITKRLILDFVLLLLAMLTIIFFWENTFLTTIILFVISICILIKTNKTNIIFFITIGLSATFIESLTISSGSWVYSTRHIFLVPLWIPLYWAMGGTVIKDIYLFLNH